MTTSRTALRASVENLCIGNVSQIRKGHSYVSSCSVNSSAAFDERKLLLPNSVYWVIGGIMITIFVLGLCENMTILFVYTRTPKLRTVNSIFVIGLSLSDLGQTLLNIPFVIVACFSKRWIFGHAGCMYIGCITTWFGITQISLLCVIAVERYFIIVRRKRKYCDTIRRAYCTIAFCFFYGLCFALAPVIGWSEYKLVPGEISCSIDWIGSDRYNMSFTMTLFVLVWFLPLSLIVFGYVRITMVVCADRDKRRNIKLSRNSRKTSRERKVAITVLLMVGAFVMSWSPYSVVALMSAFSDMTNAPASAYLVPAAFAKASIIWNPIIYISRHKTFKQACAEAFKCGNTNQSKNESENKVSNTCRNRRCYSEQEKHIDNIIGFNRNRRPLQQQSSCCSSDFGSCFKESFKDTINYSETTETNAATTTSRNNSFYTSRKSSRLQSIDQEVSENTSDAIESTPFKTDLPSKYFQYLNEDAHCPSIQKLDILQNEKQLIHQRVCRQSVHDVTSNTNTNTGSNKLCNTCLSEQTGTCCCFRKNINSEMNVQDLAETDNSNKQIKTLKTSNTRNKIRYDIMKTNPNRPSCVQSKDNTFRKYSNVTFHNLNLESFRYVSHNTLSKDDESESLNTCLSKPKAQRKRVAKVLSADNDQTGRTNNHNSSYVPYSYFVNLKRTLDQQKEENNTVELHENVSKGTYSKKNGDVKRPYSVYDEKDIHGIIIRQSTV